MCPRIFHIYGPLWINGYGLMIAIGFILFAFLSYRHPGRDKIISNERFLSTLFVGFLLAVIGGRLLFVLFDFPSSYEGIMSVLSLWDGGFSLFGSILTIIGVLPFYLSRHKVPVLSFFDLVSLYAPLMQFFARIGCFLAGCCYGLPVAKDFCCGVIFHDPNSLAPIGISLYPTQLYSSFLSLFIFVFLYFFARKVEPIPGIIFFTYLFLEGMARFFVDFWRGDREMVQVFSVGSLRLAVSSMQLIVLVLSFISLGGLVFLVWRSLRKCSAGKLNASGRK